MLIAESQRIFNFVRKGSQSQKTEGFCVADFATLSDERRSRSKIFRLFIWIKEPCVRKSEGLERSKLLGISKTNQWDIILNLSAPFIFKEENQIKIEHVLLTSAFCFKVTDLCGGRHFSQRFYRVRKIRSLEPTQIGSLKSDHVKETLVAFDGLVNVVCVAVCSMPRYEILFLGCVRL